jgi:hypothetical protein
MAEVTLPDGTAHTPAAGIHRFTASMISSPKGIA